MDPISALSLAANIYAFVEAGFRAVHQYNDFRRNALIESRDNAERRIITENLREVSSRLTADGPPFLVDLATNCSGLCKELLELLDKLTVKNPNSIRERVLEMHRKHLMESFLPILSEKQSKLNGKLDHLQDELRQLRDSRSDELTKLRSDLLEAIQMHERQSVRRSTDKIGTLLSELRDIVKTSTPEVAILTQLRFNDIYSREDAIKDPTKGTFKWPAEETIPDNIASKTVLNTLNKSLTQWLKSGSGVFHISGKAGSGKSTLMKHIWLHDRTREHLETWAGDKKLLRAAFFFWAAGNNEQKSLLGLIRSILFTILSHDRRLIPQVFPELWRNGHFTSHALDHLTRPDDVNKAFQTILRKATIGGYRICFFIDGLDEYEAPDREGYSELAKQLADWADNSHGNVKLVVSSRPYREFQDTFGSSRHLSREQIHLHQLNRIDIEEHCQKTLLEAKNAHGIADITKAGLFTRQIDESCEYLVREIGRNADGVFLWAVLVVRMIISEAKRGGSHEHLKKELSKTPRGIDELYAKILGSLGRSEKQVSNRLLYVVLTNPFEDDVNALCLKWLISKDEWQSRLPRRGEDYTEKDVIADIQYIIQHLDIWTRGLLEASYVNRYAPGSTPNSPIFESRVKLSHRTVKDYLLDPTHLSELESAFEDFDLSGLHADLRLTELAITKNIGILEKDLKKTCRYGYEILTPTPNTRLRSTKGRITNYQLRWPIVEELTRILPSRCVLPNNRGLTNREFQIAWYTTPSERTSRHHLAISLGLSDAIEGFKVMGSEPSERSLLLSACVSGVVFRDTPLVGKVPTQDLIKSLLKKGFTANERIRLVSPLRDYEPTKPPRFTATVWMILVSGLLGNITSLTDETAALINILFELLRNEHQEEVVFLMEYENRSSYHCFITLEDLLLGLGAGAHPIFDELQGWPKYESGDPTSENAPTWIWEHWRGQTSLRISPIDKTLWKLTPDFRKSRLYRWMVVSRKNYLGDYLDTDVEFTIW
ncbi:hypothetical protein O1611_g8290 [Lasiodiplodia mahajangana]|uniref:Uncharacterized protein n=1 Tax=Lasiodiplodia mahajangana TaxID=1108764 RepID=A0ACC2JD54_9PEZI|nr:hypothetical protein O1611_g8290 [Lasiodiplodia mahajangana]